MGKIKKILIAALTVCAAACLSAGVAACTDSNPDYKNPAVNGIGPVVDDPNAENRYVVDVKSMGGLPLTGVQINFKKDGKTVVSGISNNGQIIVYTEPADYTLEVEESTLPEGYFLDDDFSCNTGSGKTATLYINSSVIPTAADAGTVYSLGNVMHDFSFVDKGENEYSLTELMKTKKAVMLNFFYIACGPCQAEFPAIQEAYEMYQDDVAIVALSQSDSATAIKNYQSTRGYSFYMAVDNARLHSSFSISAFPTTIIIDRYGAIAYWDGGSEPNANIWKSLFSKFVSDNYTQDISSGSNNGDTGLDEVKDFIQPFDVAETDYNVLGAQIGVNAGGKASFHPETSEKDAPNTWPWVLENDSENVYMSASNATQDPSFAIIYCRLDLKLGDIVSYDYNINSSDGYDILNVIIDGRTVVAQHTGDSGGWTTNSSIYIAQREETIELSFTYIKYYSSAKIAVDNEFARVKNISVVNAADKGEPMDIARSFYYEGYSANNVQLGDDGYYHIANTGTEFDGAILYAELWNETPWSYNHTGAYTFIPESSANSYYASLHYLSFWELSIEEVETEISRYRYLSDDEVEFINMVLDLQHFSDCGLMPVTETLKNIMVKFCNEFNTGSIYCKTPCDENSWLEMCFFYQHFNGPHIENVYDEDGNVIGTQPGKCFVHDDPIEGMAYFNAYQAQLSTETEEVWNHVKVTKANLTFGGGGLFYTFTTDKAGVYEFTTWSAKGDEATDPEIDVYVKNGVSLRLVATQFENRSYNAMDNCKDGDERYINNPYIYCYFDAGVTVYLQLHNYTTGTTCEFDAKITYMGTSYDWLRVCANSIAFVGVLDENGEIVGSVFDSVDWAYNAAEDLYYTYENYEFGSVIYIDFIHANYFDHNDHSLKELIDNGVFDLSDMYHDNHTDRANYYYEQSIAGKSPDDELYGMVEANYELVQIIAEVLADRGLDNDRYDSGYWLSVACYYQHFGV